MKKVVLTILMATVTSISFSQAIWKPTTRSSSKEIFSNKSAINSQKVFELDTEVLKQAIAKAPERYSAQNSSIVVSFPSSEGKMERFRIVESSNMDPQLAARYPEIKSYVGQGIDNPTTSIYFSISPLGMQSMTIHADRHTEFIEPLTTDLSTYIVYSKADQAAALTLFECGLLDEAQNDMDEEATTARPNADDGKLRTYRLALSVTGEYTAYFGGTKALALAAMNNTMTRVNGIFERDFGVHMNLISNTDDVIYTSAATDPYSSASAGSNGAWNLEVQQTLTSIIGNDNYDIGHLFGASGGGGNAGCLGCVCRNPTSTRPYGKGSGFTSPGNGVPQGDYFDVDYVSHEMGHQFGANHTFTYGSEGTIAQVEPGSGSTIMGYAGITGPTYNVQYTSDPYFHAVSIQQVTNFIKTTTCNTTTVTGNSIPVVNAGPDYTIPKGTPFMLTGTATDSDNNSLTYNWEQMDKGNSTSALPSLLGLTGPAFRSYAPTSSPTRYFPRLETTQTGATNWTWESLSNVGRNLNFRLTVRDNEPSGPSNSSDDMIVSVNSVAGPFVVTSPNTAVTWIGGSTQTISWNVAGTTGNDVNASNVSIILSTDGGLTYPTTILESTPNDGSQQITIPNIAGTKNRIMVKGANHIFFDISNVNFTITTGSSDTSAPTISTNLATSQTTQTTTNLTWNASTDNVAVTGYDIYQNGVYKTSTATPGYVSSNLTPATNYTFTVRAKDAAGNVSGASNTASTTTLSIASDTTAPSAPSNLAASGTTINSTMLNWTVASDNVNVTGYNIYQNGTYVAAVTTNSYAVTGLSATTSYQFTVRAKDAAQNLSAASNIAAVTTLTPPDVTAPSAPTNLTASGTTTTSTILNWTASTDNVGVATYSVYRNGSYVTAVTGTTYTMVGLLVATSYQFTVKAKDAAQNLSAVSNTVNVTTLSNADVTAPSVPTNLSASGTTTNSTQLSWTASSDNVGVVGYNIYKSGVFLGSSTVTNFIVTGLAASTSHQFTVKAKDAAQNLSAVSNTVNVTTLSNADVTAPSVPTNLSASGTTTTSTQLSWNASTDNIAVVGYNIYRSGIYLASVTGTTYTATGLTAGTNYQFNVKAKDAAENLSAASNIANVTTVAGPDVTAPSAPTNLVASNITTSSAKLTWNASTDNVGVATYSVYRNGVYITGVTTTTYTVNGLTAGSSQQFTVKAKDAAQNLSSVSNTVNVITLNAPDVTAPTAPTNLVASNITTSSVKLTWNASTDNVGVATYSVYRNGVYITGVTTTTYTVTGLSAGSSQQFTVKAKDAAQNLSSVSNTVNVTTLSAPDVTAPTAPTNLVASNITTSSVKLTWNASTDNVGVTMYNVYRNGIYVSEVSTLTYTVTGLSSATSHQFTVKAKDASQNLSAASNTVNVSTLTGSTGSDVTAPSAPTNLVVVQTTITTTTLTWNASTDNVGVVSYSIYRNGVYKASVLGTSFMTYGLTPSTSYQFTVKAKDAAQNLSAASNTVTVTTLPPFAGKGGTGTDENEDVSGDDVFKDDVSSNEKKTFTLYPNPVKDDFLNITDTDANATYRIINVTGQQLGSGSINNGAIQVSDLRVGTYLLEITSGGETVVKRFIKQ